MSKENWIKENEKKLLGEAEKKAYSQDVEATALRQGVDSHSDNDSPLDCNSHAAILKETLQFHSQECILEDTIKHTISLTEAATIKKVENKIDKLIINIQTTQDNLFESGMEDVEDLSYRKKARFNEMEICKESLQQLKKELGASS